MRHDRSMGKLYSSIDVTPEDDDVDEEEEEEDDYSDAYSQIARSEFDADTTAVDWGGALGKLRERIGDIHRGKSGSPPNALFRVMTSDSPNEAIVKFVQEAKPDVISAMSGAVSSLLGGLSNPAIGVETIVKADGEKLGNLCFQLQMTGYMFRNAEYVLALKDLMNLEVNAELSQYKEAFDRLDKNRSGYIEASEIAALLADVYDGAPPKFEIEQFIKYFDANNDGKVSWEEFKLGLDSNAKKQWNTFANNMDKWALPGRPSYGDDEEDEDFEHALMGGTEVQGIVKVELEDGKIIEVEAKDYIQGLKQEAKALREALRQEREAEQQRMGGKPPIADTGRSPMDPRPPQSGSLGQYISSLSEKNVKKLTEGISPEVVDAMKMLVDYVLDRGQTKSGQKNIKRNQEMDIAGSALQQLALWQLVLGYRLREQEATGEWRRMLDQ